MSPKTNNRKAEIKFALGVLLIIIGTFGHPSDSRGQTLPALNVEAFRESSFNLTGQELWVLQQVSCGEKADLAVYQQQRHAPEKIRQIRAGFIDALLNDRFPRIRVPRSGIHLENAVIEDKELNLRYARISHPLQFIKCIFKKPLYLRDCEFEKDLIFDQCQFYSQANFQMKVKLNTSFAQAVFFAPANFNGAEVEAEFNAFQAKFYDDAWFAGIKVVRSVDFRAAEFYRGVSFVTAVIGEDFLASGAQIYADARIYSEKLPWYLEQTLFSFKLPLQIHDEPNNCWMKDFFEKLLTDNLLETGLDVSNFYQRWVDTVLFVEFFKNLQLSRSRSWLYRCGVEEFSSRGTLTQKSGVEGFCLSALLRLELPDGYPGCGIIPSFPLQKKDLYNFSNLRIGRNAYFGGVRFADRNEEANFRGLKVSHQINFNGATFNGPLDLTKAVLGEATLHTGTLPGVEIVGGLFRSQVLLRDAEVYDLTIAGGEQSVQMDVLNLEGLEVKRNITLSRVVLNELIAANLQVKGLATFNQLSIVRLLDLRGSEFNSLKIIWISEDQVELAQKDGLSIRLDGLDYRTIDARLASDENIIRYNTLLTWLNTGRFDTRNYLKLDRYLRAIGQENLADQVFIAMKDRERQEHPNLKNQTLWLLWGLTTGYGREPSRALLWSLLFVLIGGLCFKARYLQEDKLFLKPGEKSPWKNLTLSFFISLDQFLPAVDLGLAKSWDACQAPLAVWIYFHVLQLLGWILLPTFLAALYAQAK